MADIKLVDFKKTKTEEPEGPYLCRIPTSEDFKPIIGSEKFKHVVLIATTESGELVRWLDGISLYQAIGMMEDTKLEMLMENAE